MPENKFKQLKDGSIETLYEDVSMFDLPKKGTVAPLTRVEVLPVEEKPGGIFNVSYQKVKTPYTNEGKPFEGEGWIRASRLQEFKEADLQVVSPKDLTTLIMKAAESYQVNGVLLVTSATMASGFKNVRSGEGDNQAIGPFAITKGEWKAYMDEDADADIQASDIEIPSYQGFYAASRARDNFDEVKEALEDIPTFAQMQFAGMSGIGGACAAHILKNSPQEGINMDAALKGFLAAVGGLSDDQVDARVRQTLAAHEQLFGTPAQPRTLKQVLDDIGEEMDKVAQADGGPNALVAQYFKDNPWEVPEQGGFVTKKAFDLIVAHEVSSKALYERKYSRPIYPGLSSGVTIGIGYDVGHTSAKQVRKDWQNHLTPAHLAELLKAVGAKGSAHARPHVNRLRSIIDIPYEDALEVFRTSTVPRFVGLLKKAIGPNIDDLESRHPDSFGALVSLSFNRGTGHFNNQKSSRAIEMRKIKELVNTLQYQGIPEQFTKMKRLWVNKGVPGLLRRRDEERQLFEEGLQKDSSPGGANA